MKKEKLVLGLDPGVHFGYAGLIETTEELAFCGEWDFSKKTLDEIGWALVDDLITIEGEYNVTRIMFERSVFQRGIYAAHYYGFFHGLVLMAFGVDRIHEITACAARKQVYGRGDIKKPEIIAENKTRYGIDKLTHNAADALCLARAGKSN